MSRIKSFPADRRRGHGKPLRSWVNPLPVEPIWPGFSGTSGLPGTSTQPGG